MRLSSATLAVLTLLLIGSAAQLVAQQPSPTTNFPSNTNIPAGNQRPTTVKSWANARVVRTIAEEKARQEWEGITALTVSSDNQILALGSHHYSRVYPDNRTYISLWNIQSGEEIRTVSPETLPEDWGSRVPSDREVFDRYVNYVLSLKFSPDGETLAAGLKNKTIQLWNVKTGEKIRILRGHKDAVNAIAITPDGQTLVSASADKTIKFWDFKTGQLRRTLTGHSQAVTAVAISPDGQSLASGSADKTVRLWDFKTGRPLRTFSDIGTLQTVAFSPDGQTLASARLDYNAERQRNHPAIKLWDLKTGKNSLPLGEIDRAAGVAIAPDGKTLASYVDTNNMTQIKMWSLETGKEIRTYQQQYSPSHQIAFSPDGQSFFTNFGVGIQVWQQ